MNPEGEIGQGGGGTRILKKDIDAKFPAPSWLEKQENQRV